MLPYESTDFTNRIAVFSEPDDLHELAEILVNELGLHPTDARHEARSVPCVLSPRVTSASAERVALAIEQLGLRSEAIPIEELRAFEDLHTVHHVACQPSGLSILDLFGNVAEVVPWSDINVLSFGETPDEPSHHERPGDFTVVSAAGTLHDAVVNVPTHSPELWIVCQHPERVYRLNGSKLNFDSLAEHKTQSKYLNLRTLLQEITHHAPQAHLTPATREFLDYGTLTRFATAEQLQNVTQLHTLIAHRLQFATV